MRAKPIALCCALLSMAAATAWMVWIAAVDYGGNWTAFYRTGAKIALPPAAAGEHLYLLQGAGDGGYDGQYYHVIAQDPLLLRGTARFIDSPRLRYRRILVPVMAWIVALGQPTGVTYTYMAIIIVWLGLGSYWLSRLAAFEGWNAWWGLAFVVAPAAFLSLDRLTVDIALAALTVAYALYEKEGSFVKLYLVLILATLAKETGYILIAASFIDSMLRGCWRRSALLVTAGVPAAAWFFYVQKNTNDYATQWIQFPFSAVWEGMFHPELYPARRWFITPFEYLAWFGLILAIFLALRCWRERTPFAYAAIMFGILASVIDFNVWQEVEGFGRAFTPLLILLPLARPARSSVMPLLMLLPRAAVFQLSETLTASSKLLGH